MAFHFQLRQSLLPSSSSSSATSSKCSQTNSYAPPLAASITSPSISGLHEFWLTKGSAHNRKKIVSLEMNDRKKIGLGLTGFGVFFSILGVVFFFDKGLLAMGNILFLSGVTFTIRFKSSMQFFMKPSNYKGTVSFGVGFFLVIIGWPIIGMIVEAYGFIVLFSFSIAIAEKEYLYKFSIGKSKEQ